MTERPTIDHIARRHAAVFARDALRATSPQGRFAEDAAAIDGRELRDVRTHGGHLFYDFGDGVILHVHLGSRGAFAERAAEQPPAEPACLRLEGSRAIVEVVAASTCAVIDPAGERRVRAHLDDATSRRAQPHRAGRNATTTRRARR